VASEASEIERDGVPFAEYPRAPSEPEGGWRTPRRQPSLPEVFQSIRVPAGASLLRRFLVFAGPGYLVAVGYMDPGNWATDIQGGSAYRYMLLSVVLVSSLTAVFLQALSAKLGLATGRDLAQACRDAYPRPVGIALWISAEIGIAACDVAEVIGAAIALNLLFHIPIAVGVIATGADVLLILALQHKGFRMIEALVIALIATITIIFGFEVFLSHPSYPAIMKGFIPDPAIVRNHDILYVSLGILGATVMPHNLYLQSSIVQTRKFGDKVADIRNAIRNSYADTTIALGFAFLVNAAILIVAAAVFYESGHHDVQDIQGAYRLLTPLVGASVATPMFAIALLASGQNSTLTGTLAGQIILEGFLDVHIAPWLRRLISRSLAIVPAVIVVIIMGEKGLGKLMIFSQVILSIQLSFAVIPLVHFTSNRAKMGPFVNGPAVRALGWFTAAAIAALNAYLVATTPISS
jgi:manganese transport protein